MLYVYTPSQKFDTIRIFVLRDTVNSTNKAAINLATSPNPRSSALECFLHSRVHLEIREKFCQQSHRESRQDSRQDSWREFLRQKVSPRVSDRIICMTPGETLSDTRFFTREITNIQRTNEKLYQFFYFLR